MQVVEITHKTPIDAEVAEVSGTLKRLSSLRGRPAVMFYEDRDSTSLNATLKKELFERGRDAGLLTAVSVVAVANLSEYDWFPARNFALDAVKQAQTEAQVPIYIDWKGALQKPPLSLPSKTASVVVFDAAGTVVFRATGRLKDAERGQVFELLKSLAR